MVRLYLILLAFVLSFFCLEFVLTYFCLEFFPLCKFFETICSIMVIDTKYQKIAQTSIIVASGYCLVISFAIFLLISYK